MINYTDEFRSFFYPKNLAIFGVSSDESNLGRVIVQNLLTFGYKGEIIPVGTKEGVVFGQRIIKSLDEFKRQVDLAVILTPVKTIPGILEKCGENGIKRVIIESGGFSEMGESGVPFEKACLDVAKKFGIRFIGPNGIGVTSMEIGLALPFARMRTDLSLGPVSILAQSGGVGMSYLGYLADENLGLNKFVSVGNKLNVNENELLSYLIDDRGTKIILLYLEGFSDARKFVETASRSDKPIIVHKSNRFKESAGIASSHTAALFSDDHLVDHALRQAGCIRVNTRDEAMNYSKIFTMPLLKGGNIAVVSRSGGNAVIAADACSRYKFTLPPFPQDFIDKVERRFRASVIKLQNPLDLGDLYDFPFYSEIIEDLLKQDNIDGLLFIHGYRRDFEAVEARALIKKIEQLVEQYQKPVACVVITEAVEIDYLKRHSGIPIFSSAEKAMSAYNVSRNRASLKRGLHGCSTKK